MAEVFVRGANLTQSELINLMPAPPPVGSEGIDAAEISIARSAIFALTATSDSAACELDRVEQEMPTIGPADSTLQTNLELSIVLLGQKAGDERAVELATQWLIANEDTTARERVPGLRACTLIARAQAQFWDGRYDEVEPQLNDALALAERDGLRCVQLDALSMLALVNSYRCRKVSADDAMHRASELLRSSPELSAPVTLELAAAQRGFVDADFPAMAEALSRAHAAVQTDGDLAQAALVAEMQAQKLLERGQIAAAKAALDAAPTLRRGTHMLDARRDILLAAIEITLGRPHSALRLLRPYRGGAFSAPCALTAAKAHLAVDDLQGAENCIRLVTTEPGMQFGRWTLVEALLCTAQIAQLRNDPARAVEMLSRALEIADGDLTMPFVWAAGVFRPATRQPPDHRDAVAGFPARLRQRGIEPFEPRPKTALNLVEPFTEREQAVLRFLTTTMSTAEIADELCLYVNTIKTHLAAIYRKLAAGKRREAVLRARELELL